MTDVTRRLDAWIAADRKAHLAAKELLDRRLDFIKGFGQKPTEAEIKMVEELRADAARLYRFAIDELEELAARSVSTITRKQS